MEEVLLSVTEWLLCASKTVPGDYFQLPVAGQEDRAYRERVYCYELYHHWRSNWQSDCPFSLCGEIDKQGHPLIRGGTKPDFLVHIPGYMRNLLVVEVKAVKSNWKEEESWNRMARDLRKLTKYRRELAPEHQPGNYYAAYFWIYGLSQEEWPNYSARLQQEVDGDDRFDKKLVNCFLHERAGERAVRVAWE